MRRRTEHGGIVVAVTEGVCIFLRDTEMRAQQVQPLILARCGKIQPVLAHDSCTDAVLPGCCPLLSIIVVAGAVQHGRHTVCQFLLRFQRTAQMQRDVGDLILIERDTVTLRP